MDSVDVAGFLEFDSIVLRDGLLESSDASRQLAAEKWVFSKASTGTSGSRRSEQAVTSVRVEGEVVYLDVEEDEDQDIDVEGDETASVTQPPENIQFQANGSEDGVAVTEVADEAEPEEVKVASNSSPKHSDGMSPARLTCSFCAQHFSTEADRENHLCFVMKAVEGPAQGSPYLRAALANATPSSSSDVRRAPRVVSERNGEPPKGGILSDECDGELSSEVSAVTPATSGTSADGNHVYVWQCAVGMCEICGKVFNNNSNLKRHARVHTTGILFTCDVCGLCFPNRKALWNHKERHLRNRHPPKMYKCDVCGKRVNSPHSLKKHRNQHVQPFVCNVCGESFHRASGLEIHKYLHAR